MGVKFKDIVSPEEISLKDLEGRTVAIDAYNTIYQFLSGIRQRDGSCCLIRPVPKENWRERKSPRSAGSQTSSMWGSKTRDEHERLYRRQSGAEDDCGVSGQFA